MSSLVFRERPADGEPQGLLVLHHGRGADENDLLALGDALDPEQRLHRHPARAADAAGLARLPLVCGAARRVPRTPETFHASCAELATRSSLSSGREPGSSPGAPCSEASRWAR